MLASRSKLQADPQRRLDTFQRGEGSLKDIDMNPAIWFLLLDLPARGDPRKSTVPFYPLVRPRGTVLEASPSSQSTAAWLSGQWAGSGRLVISATRGNGSSRSQCCWI